MSPPLITLRCKRTRISRRVRFLGGGTRGISWRRSAKRVERAKCGRESHALYAA